MSSLDLYKFLLRLDVYVSCVGTKPLWVTGYPKKTRSTFYRVIIYASETLRRSIRTSTETVTESTCEQEILRRPGTAWNNGSEEDQSSHHHSEAVPGRLC